MSPYSPAWGPFGRRPSLGRRAGEPGGGEGGVWLVGSFEPCSGPVVEKWAERRQRRQSVGPPARRPRPLIKIRVVRSPPDRRRWPQDQAARIR